MFNCLRLACSEDYHIENEPVVEGKVDNIKVGLFSLSAVGGTVLTYLQTHTQLESLAI